MSIFEDNPALTAEYLHWKNGGRLEAWMAIRNDVRKFVKDFKIPAALPEELPYNRAFAHQVAAFQPDVAVPGKGLAAKAALPRLPWPFPYPGGIRAPHVHLGSEVYMLDANQWRDFSKVVMDGIRERLSRAKEIGFESLMELAEATTTLGR